MKSLKKIFFTLLLMGAASGYAQKESKHTPYIPPQEVKEPLVVPYVLVDERPMFEACKGVPKELQLKCFKKELDKHIYTHLKYPSDIAGCVQGKVYISFNINPDGTTNVTQVRSINKSLEKEAIFLIESLPCFTPGKHRGEIVTVSFAYPIYFRLSE